MKYLDHFTSGLLSDKLALLGYQQLAEDLEDITEEISFQAALKHLEENKHMLDDADDWTAYRKAKHEIILAYRYDHATENMLYNAGGDCFWSVFRTKSERVILYFHDQHQWKILDERSKYMDLREAADNYTQLVNQTLDAMPTTKINEFKIQEIRIEGSCQHDGDTYRWWGVVQVENGLNKVTHLEYENKYTPKKAKDDIWEYVQEHKEQAIYSLTIQE